MPKQAKTLDEIVAKNVERLREERNWERRTLANALESGGYPATNALIRDMERKRKGRTQRKFYWTDLVALCGALNTNLYELVLPPAGVEIADLRGLIPPDSDSPMGPEGYTERRIGRDGLAFRLFGIAGAKFGPATLAKFVENVHTEARRRLAQLEAAQAATEDDE